MPTTRNMKKLQEAECDYHTYDMKNNKEFKENEFREVSPTDINKIQETIKNELKRNCRSAISEKYGRASIDKADFIIVAKTNIELSTSICGFVTITKLENENELYIDLICTPQNIPRVRGSVLLKHVEVLAKHLEMFRIKLSSLPAPLCFYASQGYYECDDACDDVTCASAQPSGTDDDGWRMTKCIKDKKPVNIPRKCREPEKRSLDGGGSTSQKCKNIPSENTMNTKPKKTKNDTKPTKKTKNDTKPTKNKQKPKKAGKSKKTHVDDIDDTKPTKMTNNDTKSTK